MLDLDLDYDRDKKVDPDALDVEWLRHAELAHKYIKHATRCRRAERMADEKVKVTRAELIREANQDPKKTTGKDKPNAADIEAYYRSHPDHIEAKQEWIDSAYEADYAEMVQKEISWGRKASLEGLVTLHGANYFAGPSAPRNLSKEWERKRKQDQIDANNIIGSAIMKRKK